MLRYGMFAVVGTALAVQTASANQLKETLLAKEAAISEAMKHKDAQAFVDMLSDQEYGITANSGRFSNADVEHVFDSRHVDSFHFSDAELVDVDEHVKILTYKYTWSGTAEGQQYDHESVYATAVFAHRGDDWKVVFYQETPIDG